MFKNATVTDSNLLIAPSGDVKKLLHAYKINKVVDYNARTYIAVLK